MDFGFFTSLGLGLGFGLGGLGLGLGLDNIANSMYTHSERIFPHAEHRARAASAAQLPGDEAQLNRLEARAGDGGWGTELRS